jgi:hypothetical protein
VLVLELRHGARLTHEPLGELRGGGQSEIQHLHRDLAAHGFVAHAEHRGEATFAQQCADSKLVSESLLQAGTEAREIQRHGGRKT